MLSDEKADFGKHALGFSSGVIYSTSKTQLWPNNNQVHPKTVIIVVSMSQFWPKNNVSAPDSPKEGVNKFI